MSLAYSSHNTRQELVVCHSSISPSCFHSLYSNSICQRSRSNTSASGRLNSLAGASVSRIVQSARFQALCRSGFCLRIASDAQGSTPVLSHLRWNAQEEQAHQMLRLAFPHVPRVLCSLPLVAGAHFLVASVGHPGSSRPCERERESACSCPLPAERPCLSSPRSPNLPHTNLPSGNGSSLNGLERSSVRPEVKDGPTSLSPFQFPTDMQFEASLAESWQTTASLPALCQFIRERDTTTILQYH
jgi:hypothetical protein